MWHYFSKPIMPHKTKNKEFIQFHFKENHQGLVSEYFDSVYFILSKIYLWSNFLSRLH